MTTTLSWPKRKHVALSCINYTHPFVQFGPVFAHRPCWSYFSPLDPHLDSWTDLVTLPAEPPWDFVLDTACLPRCQWISRRWSLVLRNPLLPIGSTVKASPLGCRWVAVVCSHTQIAQKDCADSAPRKARRTRFTHVEAHIKLKPTGTASGRSLKAPNPPPLAERKSRSINSSRARSVWRHESVGCLGSASVMTPMHDLMNVCRCKSTHSRTLKSITPPNNQLAPLKIRNTRICRGARTSP